MSKADMKSFKINRGKFQLNTKDSDKITYTMPSLVFQPQKISLNLGYL